MAHTLFVGDISLDLSLLVPHVPEPDEKVHCTGAQEGVGGVIANTAVAFARAGGDGILEVQIGDDLASRQVITAIGEEPLTLAPTVVPGLLCRVVTVLEPHGEKRLLLYPGVSLFPDAAVVENLQLTGILHLHTALFGPSGRRLIARARHLGVGWSLDLEPATFGQNIEELADVLDGAELVFVNDRAAQKLGNDPVGLLQAMGVKSVVRTLGAQGAEFHSGGSIIRAVPPSGLPIVDTTGAGDCLAGWFLAGRAAGIGADLALSRAVRAASISCGRLGAQSAYPTAAEIENLAIAEEI